MTNVAAVHGIGQQQSGRNQLLETWLPALRDGIERAAGRTGPAVALDLGYYADLYAEHVAATKGRMQALAPVPDFTPEEAAFFADIEEEVVDEPPPAVARKGFGEIPVPLAHLAGWLDRRFGAGAKLLFFGDLVQVRRYQADDDLAKQVRARVVQAIAPDTRVLIGHSLGSIVAYETLCLEGVTGIDTLITLGSPLGLRSLQKNLRTKLAQPPVQHWVNVWDEHDPVAACGGPLGAPWTVANAQVDNDSDPHAAVRYLGKQPTGAAVVAAL